MAGETNKLSKNGFKLDTLSKKPLSMQLADTLKAAIVRGVWKVGDVLPGIHELAAGCHTSEKVPRLALEMLAKEGWTRSRRGVGAVVTDRDGYRHRDGVPILLPMHIRGWSHYFAELVFTLDAALLSAGCRVVLFARGHSLERSYYRLLAEMLKERWSLVLTFGRMAEIRRLTENSGWPFATVGMDMPEYVSQNPSWVGGINIYCGKALPELVRACVRKNVRRVIQLGYGNGAFDATSIMAVADMKVESCNVPVQTSPDAIYRASMALMRRILGRGRAALPDLFLFVDDFVAQGALFVLASEGIRVPEDVKVVTLVNRGCGLTWPVPLARMEMDPVAHGRAIAKAVNSYIKTGMFPAVTTLGSVWRSGETF